MQKRILQDFFDEKPLQKKLIAAYLIGTKITDQDFKNLKLMTDKDETGGFVTWNTHRKMSKEKPKTHHLLFLLIISMMHFVLIQ